MKTALVLFTLFFFSACRKSACVHGYVTDAKTGQPVANAKIRLSYEYSEQSSLKEQEASVITDASGEFSYTADRNVSGRIHFKDIFISGYAARYELERSGNSCEEVTIKLTPLDGVLQLIVNNTTGTQDSLFARVMNKRDFGGVRTQPYPLILAAGQTFSQTFGVVVGDSSYIMWNFTNHGPWVNVDSLLIITSDTTFFNLHY